MTPMITQGIRHAPLSLLYATMQSSASELSVWQNATITHNSPLKINN